MGKKKPLDETAYEEGARRAWLSMLAVVRKELGADEPAVQGARYLRERHEVIAVLRSLCAEFGDNEWPEELFLPDIVDKHLGDHLRGPQAKAEVILLRNENEELKESIRVLSDREAQRESRMEEMRELLRLANAEIFRLKNAK